MNKPDRIDFEKLLGFELVTRELLRGFDFQDETFGDKLGAKVGLEDPPSPPNKAMQFSKLLGFENVSEGLLQVVDFQNETLGDKLGGKSPLPPRAST